MEDLKKTSHQLVEICQKLHARNLLAAADGNVSCRLDDDRILITPTGVAKAFMSDEEMAIITLDGQILSGNPSSERLMHLEIYRHCAKARAVVHAHPPTAIAWSVARPDLQELPAEGLSEVILACGRIPIAAYARPGTSTMGSVLTPFLPQNRAIIMARHGAVCWGESLAEAYRGMERIEHVAIILMRAVSLGGISSLPEDEVQALWQLRKKLGEQLL